MGFKARTQIVHGFLYHFAVFPLGVNHLTPFGSCLPVCLHFVSIALSFTISIVNALC